MTDNSLGIVAAAAGHADPVAAVVLALAIILVAAKLGGELATRLGQPQVLGELLAGVVLGNLSLPGLRWPDPIATSASIDMLAGIGVLILLFEVGLGSTVAQMMKVGLTSLLVAILGVAAPFALGWGVSVWLMPHASAYVHMFLGATLCATSVGITARVLKDLGRAGSSEARVILGAAVIDDVLGLVILSAVTGLIAAAEGGQAFSFAIVAMPLVKAIAFLAGALYLGAAVSPTLFAFASKLRAREVLLAAALAFCFLLSWLASVLSLAPIVGAFAAGLILEPVHLRDFQGRGDRELEDLIHPISAFLVPVFFVLMGMHTDVRAFGNPGVLGLAVALTAAAILGKQACSLGVTGKGVDRWTVGLGMIPRGEVGLIFANIGLGLVVAGERIVDSATFSAIVVMVVVTTVVTPPALKWRLGRHAKGA